MPFTIVLTFDETLLVNKVGLTDKSVNLSCCDARMFVVMYNVNSFLTFARYNQSSFDLVYCN